MDWQVVASFAILVVGLLLFFILANRRSYKRHPAVEHYTKARDQLSNVQVEEPEEEDDDDGEYIGGGFSLGSVLGAMIFIMVSITVLIPMTGNLSSTLCSTSNMSVAPLSDTLNCINGSIGGPMGTVLSLLPAFIGLAGLAMVVRIFV